MFTNLPQFNTSTSQFTYFPQFTNAFPISSLEIHKLTLFLYTNSSK